MNFVPFIVGRLEEMRKRHNILLVTNDHVETLKRTVDNTIRVSAIDCTRVQINDNLSSDRKRAIMGLSVADDYQYRAYSADFWFFMDAGLFSNQALVAIAFFTVFLDGLYDLTFWNSSNDSAALVPISVMMMSFFAMYPFFFVLCDYTA